MPFSFPASPELNALSTQNGRQYKYVGSNTWELVGNSGEDSLLRSIFVPAAPTGLAATAGNATVALSWTAPTGVIAQAPITGYRVEYTPSGGSAQTVSTGSTATSYTVSSLANGTAYTARVAAVNAVGAGSYTSASAAVTPTAGTPPNAPTNLTATEGNTQIALAWTAPSAPGTSAITGYTVEYTPSGGSPQTVSTGSTATSYTLSSLTNGTAYTVRVAAVSSVGTGTFTAASSAVTPVAATPDPDYGNVSLLLHMEGTSLVDSSPNNLTVTALEDGQTPANPFLVTTEKKFGSKSFLGNGAAYAVYAETQTSATLGFGTGDYCLEGWFYSLAVGSSFSYAYYLPNGVFVAVQQVDGYPQLRINNGSWQYSDGTAVPTGQWNYIAVSRTSGQLSAYLNGTRVFTGADSRNYGASDKFYTSSGWNGYVDEIRVTKGTNRGMTGATVTVPTTAFSDSGPMLAPTSLAATSGNAQVSLTWTAPTYNGGSAITDYSVQYSTNSGSTWTTFSRTASTTASQVVNGLTNGTAYVFRVAGINSNGTGTYTAASSSVTPNSATVPDAPNNVRNYNGYWTCYNQNTVVWNAPTSNGGSAITGYRWRIGSGGTTTLISPSSGSSAAAGAFTGGLVEGLSDGSFQVAAVNALGTGPYASFTLQVVCD